MNENNEIARIFAELGLKVVDKTSPRKLSARDKTINQCNKALKKLKSFNSYDEWNSSHKPTDLWAASPRGNARLVQAKYSSRCVGALYTEAEDTLEGVIEAVEGLKEAALRLSDDFWAEEEARRNGGSDQ